VSALTTALVLALPSDEGLFHLETDASDLATGAVLSQVQLDGTCRPVGYTSKAYNDMEKSYTTYDKEMLAVMRGLEEWRSLLIGAAQPFEILTDHWNLMYFREPQKLTVRQVNWTTKQQDYSFTIKHIDGSSNSKADALSRPEGIEKQEWKVDTLLPERFFVRMMIGKEGLENEKPDKGKIIQDYPDSPTTGHLGVKKTLELIKKRRLSWKGIQKDVQAYVKGFLVCQKAKPKIGPGSDQLHLLPIANRPWEIMSWDLIGPLPESWTYNAIVTMVDTKTKAIKLEPGNVTITAMGAAVIMKNRVFREEGLLAKVISDRGPQFICNLMKELYKLLKIEGNPSTVYHPQTDGQTERVNREVEKYLRMFTNHRQDDWVDWLPVAEFAFNNVVHEATGQTPFFLNKGRHP
jgi:hypothetical protein